MNLLTNGIYYGTRGYGYGFDPTYLLAIVGFLITLAAQGYVKSAFNKYNRVASRTGMTGAMAARRVLDSCGLNVAIEHVDGQLTDHYDPRTKTLRLSDSTYNSASVAAICVAAHECGHAVQDQKQYGPLVLRSTLVPAANLGSQLAMPVFIAGMIFSIRPLLTVGILLFSLAVVFQLVTLPVEFDASKRALAILKKENIIPEDELSGGRKVLIAAALTYVAALVQTMLQLIRLILLSRRRNDD